VLSCADASNDNPGYIAPCTQTLLAAVRRGASLKASRLRYICHGGGRGMKWWCAQGALSGEGMSGLEQ